MSNSDQDVRYSVTAEDRFSRTFANLRRDVAGTGDLFTGLLSKASSVSGVLSTMTLGAVGGAGFGLALKRLADDLDALNDAADSTGSTVEKLSALEDAARRTGTGLETVQSAVLKLNKQLIDANPDNPIAQTLRRIGVDAAELRKQDPADALVTVAKALNGFGDSGAKSRAILELTGKEAKVLAPLMKDLAEAGELNTKVTADQAAQAEIFNKELFRMEAEATNAARALASKLLPAINQLFADVRTGGVGNGITKALGLETLSAQVDQAVAAYRLIGLARERITPLSILEKDPTNAKALAELARIDALAQQLAASFKTANDARLKLVDNGAGAGRGFINPPLVKPDLADARPDPKKPVAVSEAQRYLETLQKQGEKLQELTTYQQLLADIENKRIDGITPKLERDLKLAAQRVDLQKQLNTEKEREAGFQKLLQDKDQADVDEVQRLLSQTTGGKLQALESQADKLLDFSRRIGQGDPRQTQVLEAMQRLREEARQIVAPVSEVASEFDKLADVVEKSMDRTSGAIIDMVVDAKGGVSDLGKAFGRDVLRALIEDPVRDTMKGVAAEIRKAFQGGGEGGGGLLDGLFRAIGSGSGGGGGGGSGGLFGDLFKGLGGLLGFTSRANGGDVNAGNLVRWKENGREWFVPEQDGSVITESQLKTMAGGGGVQQTNHFNIYGGNPAETQRMIDAALARNNAQLLRSRNTGGAFAR